MGFDPDAYLKKQNEMAGFDPDAYLKKVAPKEEGFDYEAARVGLEKGITLGARPFIAGLGGAIGGAIGEGMAGRSIVEGAKQGFTDSKKEARAQELEVSDRSPWISGAGELAGSSILLAPASALKAASLGLKGWKGATALGGTMGAGQAIGNADSLKEAAGHIGTGAALGGIGHGVVNAAGSATNAIERKLRDASSINFLKSVGARAKDHAALEGKKRTQDLAEFGLNRGIVGVGDSVESVAKKSEISRKDAGQALESIYNYAKTNAGDLPGFNPAKDREEILRVAADKLGDSVNATSALTKLGGYLDDLVKKYGDASLDPRKTNDIKSAMDEAIDFARDPMNKQPDIEKAFHAARNFVLKKNDETIEAIGAKTGSKQLLHDLKEANTVYGGSKEISGMAKRAVTRENAKKSFGLRESILTGGGLAGLGTGFATGDVESGLKGALVGASLGTGIKTLERYGPALLAKSEKFLADKISSDAVLRRMLKNKPAMYQVLLKQTLDSFAGPGGVPIEAPIQRLTGETP